MRICFLVALLSILSNKIDAKTDSLPNILLVIADDIGVDMVNGYGFGGAKPKTPTMDSLRGVGITFENVWSAPACTPTRAAIMSGKYGVKTGVVKAPGNLDTTHTSIFRAMPSVYESALVGKWHISQPIDKNHPMQHGISYYAGEMAAKVADYNKWDLVENGVTTADTNYVTSVFTDKSLGWITGRTEPWLMWLAHVAPHSPFHTPPAHMFTTTPVNNNRQKYMAMIESFDYELNRLIQSIPDSVMENTIVIVLGDNGTPGNFTQDYPTGHGKGTLYEGGIRVPMIIAGKNVNRKGVREKSLIHVADLYSTMLYLGGEKLSGGKYNSLSFSHLLNSNTVSDFPTRDYNYSEIESSTNGWTVRNKQYKLIEYQDGTQEFYDLLVDSLETKNLISQLSANQIVIKDDLKLEAQNIRTNWSCRDYIKNGDELGIDCEGSFCQPCVNSIQEETTGTWKLFPNPVQGDRVYFSETIAFSVFDALGNEIVKYTNSNSLDISRFESGTYILKDKDGKTARLVIP